MVLAVESDMANISVVQNTNAITLYAQDPCFNAVDKDFLRSLNVTILKGNGCFSKITSNSLVFHPCLPGHVIKDHILPRPAAALYVGSSLRGLNEFEWLGEASWTLLPDFPLHETALASMGICVAKKAESVE